MMISDHDDELLLENYAKLFVNDNKLSSGGNSGGKNEFQPLTSLMFYLWQGVQRALPQRRQHPLDIVTIQTNWS